MARSAAAMLVLLAALLHLLACAHSPAVPGTERAVTGRFVAAPHGQTPASADEHSQRHEPPQHHHVHCCGGEDEPTVQPSRDVALAVHAVHSALTADCLGAQPSPTRLAVHTPPPDPGSSSTGQTRARLGAWRT
ncbi:hypothetical protein ACFWR9_19160 [Streptomyces sp. NPDC058534]|uniref:hypothetical protein n=1 Tax=Streptomyces sp. NPDC058534 TaxID=3346541 RepID=UPI00365CD307